MNEGERTPDSSPYDDRGCDPRAPFLTRFGAAGIAGLLRAIYATVRAVPLQPEIHEGLRDAPRGVCIGAFWHRHVGIAPHFSYGFPWVCLVSRSSDGELLARVMAHLGGRSVRGSSGKMDGRNKGGASALRQLARLAGEGVFPIFTPDGSNGPPEKVKPGVIYLGALTGLPIYPAGFAASRCARLPTWDKTIIPLPFSKVIVSYGEPLRVPPSIDDAALEIHRRELELRILAANEAARASIRPGEE